MEVVVVDCNSVRVEHALPRRCVNRHGVHQGSINVENERLRAGINGKQLI
jgi:hypothetical protein